MTDLTVQVNASARDAQQNAGTVTTNGVNLNANGSGQYAGFIFNGLADIDGMVIESAALQIYLGNSSYDSPDVTIRGSLTTTNFAGTDSELSNRYNGGTTATVNWTASDIGTGWKSSPSLVDIIQEIADNGSFSDTLTLLVKGNGSSSYLRVTAYDSDTSLAAKLVITYSTGAIQATAVDGVKVSPASARGLRIQATALESFAMSGGTGRKAAYAAGAGETLKLLELLARGINHQRLAEDSVDISETAAVGCKFIATALDTWKLMPAATRRADFVAVPTDGIRYEENVATPLPSESDSFEIVVYEDGQEISVDNSVSIATDGLSVLSLSPYVALEFRDIDVPKGATFTSLAVRVYVKTNDDPYLAIQADKDATPAALTATDYDISSRTRTTASVPWSGANIGTGWKDSPDISSVGNEIVNLSDWERGGNIVIILRDLGGGGSFTFYAKDYDAGQYTPKLVGEWYIGGITVSASAADTVKLAEMTARRALIAQAVGDTARLAAAATTTLALLVVDEARLAEMVAILSYVEVYDNILLAPAAGLTYFLATGDTARLTETLQRMATTRTGAVDALKLATGLRVVSSTLASDSIDLSTALDARLILSAILHDAVEIGYNVEGDMSGTLEGVALDGLDFGVLALAGWRTYATASDTAAISDAIGAARHFVAAAADSGQLATLVGAAVRARATGLDAAAFAGQLATNWATMTGDTWGLSGAAGEYLAVVLYALASDYMGLAEGTATTWHVSTGDIVEFVAAVAAVMHWVETIQDALGIVDVTAHVDPRGIVTIEVRLAQATVGFAIAMPGADVSLKQPRVDVSMR